MVSTIPGVTLDQANEYLLDIDSRLREDEAAMELPSPSSVDPDPVSEVGPESIQERFEAFHADNPWVYDRLRVLAFEMVDKGHQKVGIKMLWEVLRWQTLTAVKVAGGSTPKLDNSLTSRYARALMDNEPRLADVFDTRSLRS